MTSPSSSAAMFDQQLIRNTFWHLIPVSILYYLATWIQPVIDAMIAGKMLGSAALEALVVAAAFSFFTSMIVSFVMVGGRTRASFHIGRGDYDGLCGVYSFCMLFFLAVGAVLALAGWLIPVPLTRLLGAQDAVLGMASNYVGILCVGSFFSFAEMALIFFAMLMGKQNHCFIATALVVITDVALDIFFITAFHWGTTGLALATVIGYLAGTVYLLLALGRTPLRFRPSLIDRQELPEIIRQGLPFTIGSAGIFVRSVIYNHFVGGLAGSAAMVLGLSLQNSINGWLSAPTAGCAEVVSMMTGIYLGEGDTEAIKKILRVGLRGGWITASVLAGLAFLFAPLLVSAYGVTAAAATCVVAVRAFCLKIVVGVPSWVMAMYYETIGREKLAHAINIFEPFALPVLLVGPMVALFGNDGFWYVYVVADIITIAVVYGIIAAGRKRFPLKGEDFYLLDGRFTDEFVAIRSLTIHSDVAEVVRISQALRTFCQEHGVDRGRAYKIGLSAEEMAGNIVAHAFDKGGDHAIDLCLQIRKSGDIALRIRDNGSPFNPIAYASNAPSDEFAGIGIRMVKAMARKMEYHHIGGLNNLLIIV